MPASSLLTVTGATSWYLFDGSFNLLSAVIKRLTFNKDWDGSVPEGAYLQVYGEPGMAIQGITK